MGDDGWITQKKEKGFARNKHKDKVSKPDMETNKNKSLKIETVP